MTEVEKLLTEREAAELLGVPVRRLQNLRQGHDGPAFIKNHRRVYYTKSLLAEWMNRSLRTSTKQTSEEAK